jgi:hypothetical protein
MTSLTRLTALSMEIPFRMLEFPFLMSAAMMDALLADSELRNWDRTSDKDRADDQASVPTRTRRHRISQAARRPRVVPRTRKAA